MSESLLARSLFSFTGTTAQNALLAHDAHTRTDDSTLRSVIGELLRRIGADGLLVAVHEATGASSIMLYASGICAHSETFEQLMQAWEETPAATAAAAGPSGRWHQLTTSGEPCSVLRSMSRLDRTSFFSFDALFTAAGADDRSDFQKIFAAVLPVLVGFLRTWNQGQALQRRIGGMESALNNSDIGVILLGRSASIIFANSSAQGLMVAGTGIRRAGKSIAASELADSLKLQLAIESVVGSDAPSLHRKRELPIISIQRGGRSRPLLLSVLPPDQPPSSDEDIAAVLFIFDPDEELRPSLEPACRLYGLSPVETNLACHLAAGASLAEAAVKIRVKEQTARTYLKQIFLKTSTKRQADLVRLLFSSMVRSGSRQLVS